MVGIESFIKTILTIKCIVLTDPDGITISLSPCEEVDGFFNLSHILILSSQMITGCPIRKYVYLSVMRGR